MNNPDNILPLLTDEPKARLWQLLNQYSYPHSIVRRLKRDSQNLPPENVIEFTAGCMRQAEAYFHAADNAPLHISPLLYYNGTTNLLAGGSCLLPVPDHKYRTMGWTSLRLLRKTCSLPTLL